MSDQLELLNKAIASGRQDFEAAILSFAPHYEEELRKHGRLPDATPIGVTTLEDSQNPDIKKYLEYTSEWGNESDEMDRYAELVIEVLEASGQFPRCLAEQKRILKEGL